MTTNNFDIKGLNDKEVILSREKNGQNSVTFKEENHFLKAILKFLKDPMILLLLVASIIYFISGKTADAIFLASAIVLVSGISSYQNARSKNALAKLKDFTKPKCKVIRNGKTVEIKTEELVIGDSLLVEEGSSISADGIIIHSNDFSVNEAILTGESMSVIKDKSSKENSIFQGTTVASGLAITTITAIGSKTKLGIIGESLQNIKEEKHL